LKLLVVVALGEVVKLNTVIIEKIRGVGVLKKK